jgi:hypothetical protein
MLDREWDLINIERFGLAAGRSSFLVLGDEGGHLITARVPNTGPLPNSGGIERDGQLGAVLSDGASYLATWREHTFVGSPAKQLAWQFDESGAPLAAAPTELPPSIQPSDGVWNGSSYLVVWATGQVQAARLSSTGNPISSPVAIAPGECPAVTWDGRNHLVVWSIEGAIRGARVTGRGAIADPGGFAIASGGCPRVAYDGVHHVVIFADGLQSAVRAARVTPEGTVVDSPPLIIELTGAEPDVASLRDGRALVAYSRESPIQGTKASRVWVREMTEVCECDAGTCEGPACVRVLPSEAPEGSGCACSIPGSRQRKASPWLLVVLLLLMTRRARKANDYFRA